MKCLCPLFVVVALTVATHAAENDTQPTRTVFDIAVKSNRPPGAPQYSDVCFSSRWKRPCGNKDPHDTLRDAAVFHATRLDWVYSIDPAWIRECRKHGYKFGGTLNTILPDAPGEHARDKGRVLDKAGQPITAPWMRKWKVKPWWGCVNSPEYRKSYLAHAKLLIDAGVDTIHMDDPGLNFRAADWGGCYCPHCQEKAKELGMPLEQGKQQQKAFQKVSVKEFFSHMRKEIDRHAGRHVPFSSNNWDGRSGFPYDLFEYGIAELPERSGKPDHLFKVFNDATSQGRAQVFTFGSVSVPLTRRLIALAYACGGHILVPYDVYHGEHPRIFGKPKEYADLYGFVRANADFLDAYENAAVAGGEVTEERYGKALPMSIDAKDVFAVARAHPGEPDAPVVVHVVDWRDDSKPCVLELRTACFFGHKSISANLLIPPAYDKAIHAKAEESDDFSLLSRKQDVQIEVKGDYTRVSVPSLGPWGMVILTPKATVAEKNTGLSSSEP